MGKPSALCKIDGMLAICEFTLAPGQDGCPRCHAPVSEYHGWLECHECDFAVLKSGLERIHRVGLSASLPMGGTGRGGSEDE